MARRSRIRALSLVTATASGGLWRNPRRAAAAAAIRHSLVIDGQDGVKRVSAGGGPRWPPRRRRLHREARRRPGRP